MTNGSMRNYEEYFTPPTPQSIPRPLVIDGCNIGRSASGFSRTHVDCAGLVAVVRWLVNKKFDVTVFLPVVYNNANNYNARNAELLHKLENLGIVTFTPARSGRGMRKAFINYDDLYVVSYAARHGGCILSGDKFKDILHQSCYSDFHEVIRNRTIDIKFRPLSLDFVRTSTNMFYRHAPELFIYENSNVRYRAIQRRLYVEPQDEDFHLVRAHARLTSPEQREFLCSQLDSLLVSMSFSAGKEFRDVDELPYTDSLSSVEMKIEDIVSPSLAKKFYEKYSNYEQKVDALNPYVMQPTIDVADRIEPRRASSPEKTCALINLSSDSSSESLRSRPITEHIAPHPDLTEIQLKPPLPENLSSHALLEWFNKAGELKI
ncbi:unnamed protein product [Caenorhabditis bovis]|uniref:RNase NYN domain-containing protein n=1 Tax=Caenorhabditis bovis TaxID=2654633 RepID=A0A8S1FD57_9PELO|nr:unnamed protein product [Caenorhabditis bovis]